MYDGILSKIIEMAKKKKRRIILPESNDKRIYFFNKLNDCFCSI